MSAELLQSAPAGSITGSVVDAVTKRPLEGAVVYLAIEGRGPVDGVPRVVTDDRGRFVFRHLPPSDRYFVQASRQGYFDGAYGATTPFELGRPIALAPGDWFSKAIVELLPSGSISGRVVDQSGEAVISAYVTVYQRIALAGHPHLAVAGTSKTDDQGRYSISGLTAGDYFAALPSVQHTTPISGSWMGPILGAGADVVQAMGDYIVPPNARTGERSLIYPLTFYPSASSIKDAEVITITYGQPALNIDFRWTPVPGYRVSGTVVGALDSVEGLLLRLISPDNRNLGPGSEVATTIVGARGAFTFLGVPSGDYILQGGGSVVSLSNRAARFGRYDPRPPTIPGARDIILGGGGIDAASLGTTYSVTGASNWADLWGATPISVASEDLTNRELMLKPTGSLRGRVRFEGKTSPGPGSSLPTVRVSAEPATGDPWLGIPSVRTSPDNPEFVLPGLRPGLYVIRGSAPSGFVQLSVTCGGRDCYDEPLQVTVGSGLADAVVTFSDRLSELAGNVTTPDGSLPLDGIVLAFPADPKRWENYGLSPTRIRQARIVAGAFRIQGLPGGDYQLIALAPSHLQHWTDRGFLQKASPLATRVSVRPGELTRQDLQTRVMR